MKTRNYLIDFTEENIAIIHELEIAISCFTSIELREDGYIDFTIICKEEDISAIEKFIERIA